MQSSIVINTMHYISISGIFIFSLLSLFMLENKKRMLFLFLVFLFSGTLSFSFYSGILFFAISLIAISFFVLFYLYAAHIEFYLKEKLAAEKSMAIKDKFAGKILRLVLPLIICLGIGYLFYKFAFDFFYGCIKNEAVPVMSLANAVKELQASYIAPVIILISILFISTLWFILIFDMSREE